MYESFFGLKDSPFSIAPNPRYLYMSEQHQEALAHLLYGVRQEGGFIVLTGEVGTGKTTVCRCFLEQLPQDVDVAFILNSKLTRRELLETLCDELDIPCPESAASSKPYIDAILAYLLDAHGRGRKTLLLIDEAQNLAPDVLEQVRLLTNLETNNRKLLQIVLVGQPELQQVFSMPEMRQLAQRVTARYHLNHLRPIDVWRYICHRLDVAGSQQQIIPASLVKPIMYHTRGIPRLINVLCDRMLLGAYVQKKHVVNSTIVKSAAKEVFGKKGRLSTIGSSRFRVRVKLGVAAVLFLAAGLSYVFNPELARLPQQAMGVLKSEGVASDTNNNARPSAAETVPQQQANRASNVRQASDVGQASNALQANNVRQDEWSNRQASAQLPRIASVQPSVAASPKLNADRQGANAQTPTVGTSSERARSQSSLGPLVWPAAVPLAQSKQLAVADLMNLWQQSLPIWPGDQPCDLAERAGLSCLSKRAGSINDLRVINRPVILSLANARGEAFFVTLERLEREQAYIRMAGQMVKIPVRLLPQQWGGNYTLFWRAPSGYYGPIVPGTIGTEVREFSQRLGLALGSHALAQGVSDYTIELETAVRDFQRQQGLEVDGVVGMQTLIALNSILNSDAVPFLVAE
jgi:general secretion pathway protein A